MCSLLHTISCSGENSAMDAMESENWISFSKIFQLCYCQLRYFFVYVLGVFILYACIPIAFCCSSKLQKLVTFQSVRKCGHRTNFNRPANFGIAGGRNLYINSEPRIALGAWHILPFSSLQRITKTTEKTREELFGFSSGGRGIMLYLHGNSGSRATAHRVELYRRLQAEDYHVVCFDYRGFGDSSNGLPTETTAAKDAMAVLKWVIFQLSCERVHMPLFIWGHSLGAGIALSLLAKMCTVGEQSLLSGLILESPFSNFGDAMDRHCLTKAYKWIPGLLPKVRSRMRQNDLAFDNQANIKHVSKPIMILHAVDDNVVPYDQGVKLYKTACETARENNKKDVCFHAFRPDFGYGHTFICRAAELPVLIHAFTSRNQEVGGGDYVW